MSNGRIERLRLQSNNDCILISHPTNIRYLCGYSGSHGLLLLTTENSYLLTDSRYALQCAQECFDVEIVIAKSGLMTSALELVDSGELTIEAEHVSVATRESIASAAPELRVRYSHDLVESLRVVKDSSELD